MPLGYTPARTTQQQFLHGTVTALVPTYRTYEGDAAATKLAQTLCKLSGVNPDDDYFLHMLAECVTYTIELTFSWLEGMPQELIALESFWNLVKRNKPEEEWLKFFKENLPTYVVLGQDADSPERAKQKLLQGEQPNHLVKGWMRAVRDAFVAWQPPDEWKMMRELTEEQRNDPN